MSLKGKVTYFCLPLFFYVLGRMLHPAFYLFIVFLLIYDLKVLPFNWFVSIMIIIFLMMMLFRIPQPLKTNDIKGKIVSIDENSIVVKDGYHKVKVYGKFKDCQIYDEITLSGQYLDVSMPDNDHAFCYKKYLYSLNIFDTVKLVSVQSHQHKKHLYHYLEQRVNQNESLKSIVSLFILGTKDEQMKEYYEKLTDLSLVHLFALSGMHLTILKKWLCQFLRFFFSKKNQNRIAMIMIGIYIFVIPYNISFLRAYLMMLLPMVFHKYVNELDIFSALTIIMLFYNPYLLFNLSFIFSYSVYLMIILFQKNKRMKYLLLMSSLPVILSVNYKINVISLILSLCMTPFIERIYQCILYYILLGQWFAPLLSILLYAFQLIVDFLYDFSFYIYFPKPNLCFIFIYYFIYFQIIIKVNMNRRFNKEFSCLLGLLIAFYFYPFYNMQGKVVMISVGQGDCFLIKQPFSKGNVLIDTGGLKNRDVASETIIPYLYSEGIRKLDAVFISHDDFDHCGALSSLQENFMVQEVVRDFKEKKIGDLTFKNLALSKKYFEANDQSTVIYVQINHLNYLFTGDISETVEKDLYDTYHSLDVQVLKVAHHGSRSSTSNYLMKMIKPKIALVSVGKNNVYKHPHFETIQRLEDYGVRIYRSDVHGMVKIYYYGDDNYIESHHDVVSNDETCHNVFWNDDKILCLEDKE